MTDQIKFEADMAWNDVITEDIEQQILDYAKQELGRDISGDDIDDYTVTLTVEATVND